MAEQKIRKCAIYTRVSTEEQARTSDFSSLDNQRETCQDFIKSQRADGWQVYPEIYEDAGFSAKNMDRPALKKLFADIKQKKLDIVVVYKYDRLSRSLKDFVKILDLFDKYGISFVAVTQRFDTSTSTGRLMMTMLMGFAQWEREINSERTKEKRESSAKKGKWLGGYPVLGYSLDFTRKKLVVNKKEIPQVQDMFRFYLEEKSLSKAAKRLNLKVYRTKEWVTKKGKKLGGSRFNKTNLVEYLKNPIYLGKIRYKDKVYDGEHEGIVDQKIFDRVQKLLGINGEKRKSINQDKHNFLLRGLVRCAYCNSVMTPNFAYSKGRKYFYYKCTKVMHMDRTACKYGSISSKELERVVVKRLEFLGNNKTIVEKIVEKAQVVSDNELPKLQKEKAEIAGELRKIKEKADNLLDALSSAGGEKNSFIIGKLNELQERERMIKDRQNQVDFDIVKLENRVVDADVVRRNLQTFGKVYEKLTPEEKKELVRLLIKEVLFDQENGKIKITLRALPDIGLSVDETGHISFDESMKDLPETDCYQNFYFVEDSFDFQLKYLEKGSRCYILTNFTDYFSPVEIPVEPTLGSNIKRTRISRGLTQLQLARLSTIAPSNLVAYERGEVSSHDPFIIQKIARALQTNELELYPNCSPEAKDVIDAICPPITLGSKIRNLRLKQHIQQKDLAKLLGIHKVSLCRYEKGLSVPDRIIRGRIEAALKVNL